ncbi:MAG: GerMN domain-containing protein [Propionicimonas sp.]|jgi:spore germination protein GerM
MVGQARCAAILAAMVLLGACAPAPVAPSAAASPSPSAAPSMTVLVYFGNSVLDPGATDCARVFAVTRTVPAGTDGLTPAMQELLAGPTPAEAAQGYHSWFSAATADALISARVSGSTSYVDLTDLRSTIPNASTSCGSAALLAQLGTTAQQAGMTPQVRYAIEGHPRTFWEWLQRGCDAGNDNCDPAPFSR